MKLVFYSSFFYLKILKMSYILCVRKCRHQDTFHIKVPRAGSVKHVQTLKFLKNIGNHIQYFTVSKPRRSQSKVFKTVCQSLLLNICPYSILYRTRISNL